jgi:formylmethanofuran dehydrogenase subunit D
MNRVGEAVDTVEYYTVAQSTTSNYQFAPNGGDISTYNVGIARDGNQVTFKNFFSLYNPADYTPTIESDFTGTYDEATKTVTVPTSSVFSKATVVASIYNYYVGTLICGQIDNTGTLYPDEQLVFHVEGDFEKLTTDQSVAVAYYPPTGGQSYGLYKSYRRIVLCVPKETGDLITFNESVDLGGTFPNVAAVKDSIPIINIGKGDVEYAVDVESDPEGYISSSSVGVIGGQSYAYAVFELAGPEAVGDVEANAVINYDTGKSEGSVVVSITGSVEPLPDYTPIVKKGDFTFNTSIDYPFRMVEFNNVPAAMSGVDGEKGISDLYVYFNVPEGKKGIFSFEGYHKNDPSFRYSWGVLSGYFVDSEAPAFSVSDEGPMNGTLELAPGDHYVRFQHQNMYASGIKENGLYLTGLSLDFEDLPADAAELKTETLDFGNFIVEDGYDTSKTSDILIQNRGSNPLTLLGIESDNDEFKPDVTAVKPATSLNDLIIPVTFSTSVPGVKTGNITINTSAGNYVVPVKAKVFEMPDFSQIITEGMEYITVSTSPDAPFIVEDGVAYNANCDDGDLVPTVSRLKLEIMIPEGKIARLSWEGHAWGNPPADLSDYTTYWYKDRAGFEFQNGNNMGILDLHGYDVDVSSEAFASYNEGSWASFLTFIPHDYTWGADYFTFVYTQDGDSVTVGKNRFEVKNIRLHVEDFKEHAVELVNKEGGVFEPTYVSEGRSAKTTVQLRNVGSEPLTVESIRPEKEGEPFGGIVPEDYYNNVAYNSTMDVTLTFSPTVPSDEEKEYTGNVIITTNAGDVVVPVVASTKAQKGIIYPGDFEDDAVGWKVFDRDGDGLTWRLGWFFWGERPAYVRSGIQCIGSASSSDADLPFTPDNWAFSPAMAIPADGGKLEFFISAFHPNRFAEHYSFYIVDKIDCLNNGNVDYILNNFQPIIEETINEPSEYNSDYTKVEGWQQKIIDLNSYAGQTVYLVFRHHDCTGQYVLRLDDLFLFTNDKFNELGINALNSDKNIISSEYYTIDGKRVDKLVKGVNVVRSEMKDGSVKVQKVIIK